MPLSEQEQRLLEEMERGLYQNDSDFAARIAKRQGRPTYTSITLGILGAFAGVAVVIAGVMIRQPIIGVVGFVLMLGGVLFALRPGVGRSRGHGTGATGAKAGTVGAGGGSFMDRMNDKWDKRNQEN